SGRLGRRAGAARGRCRARLHPQGLRPQPDHGRDRRAGERPGQGRVGPACLSAMPQAPRTRYALSGDAHVAYQVFGEGNLDLVFVPGFVSNIEHYWDMPQVPDVLERLGSFARVVIFDKRGTGLSDPVAGPPPLEQRMDDMKAVMDAAEVERAALYGISEGGPASVLFAATYPDRTSALVLYGSTPRFRTDDDISWGATDEQVHQVLADDSARSGEAALLDAFAPS